MQVRYLELLYYRIRSHPDNFHILPLLFRFVSTVRQPCHATAKHNNSCNDTKDRCCPGVCSKISHWNGILNLWASRKCCHGKGKCAKSDSTRNETLRNISCAEYSGATGSITNATTNKETPPYVKIAQVNTTESTARFFPNFKVQNCAIDCAFPEISINFAKTAPNR